MKRRSRFIASAIAFGLLAGTSSPIGAADEPVTISFVSASPEAQPDEYWDEVVGYFEADNPDVNVERVPAPDDDIDTYAKQLLATGAFPDVVVNISDQDFVPLGALQPFEIDDEINRIQHVDATKIDGQLYKLSAGLQPTSYIWYNEDLFEQAGDRRAAHDVGGAGGDHGALKAAGIHAVPHGR